MEKEGKRHHRDTEAQRKKASRANGAHFPISVSLCLCGSNLFLLHASAPPRLVFSYAPITPLNPSNSSLQPVRNVKA